MASRGSVSVLIATLPDQAAIGELWDRYYNRLERLAHQKLGTDQRGQDAEDVVISVFDSFFKRQQDGQFVLLSDRDDLWRLLSLITVRKAINHWKREQRQRGRNVLEESALKEVISREPGPEEMLAVQEILESLPEEKHLRRIADLCLKGYSHQAIANELGCHLSTIDLRLRRIRKKLRELEAEDADV
jgi:DNA-directed RNA polymerase specialized sigma24 family protein